MSHTSWTQTKIERGIMTKEDKKYCKNEGCTNKKSYDRAECSSCRGKRRRGTLSHQETRFKSGGDSPKILFIDIETKPNLVWTWGIWQANIGINQIVTPGGMMCFSAKWYGDDNVLFYSEWDTDTSVPGLRMVTEAWSLLDQADFVVHFYGSRFDVPHLNTEFLKQGFPPPSPYKQIDLKMAVSKSFKFTSNKLQFVSQVLGLEGKEEHEGFPLWTKCMDRDPDALARMQSYNERDTILLEEVYEALLAWIPNHPHRNLYNGAGGCPRCGAEDTMVDAGFAYTNLSKFAQFRCTECDTYFRSNRRIEGAKIQNSMFG